ncbi:MAG: hypothetical protein WBA83_17085 [Burkholderiaceae bacterium]
MDGNWNKWYVVPLYLATLPARLWRKLFPPAPSEMQRRLDAQQKQTLEERERSRK